MPKVLITGNAGMIGSVLATRFLNKGYQVVGIDDLSGGSQRNVDIRVKFYIASILDVNAINSIFETERPDFVIHAACFAAECLSPFIRNFITNNIVVGTTNIINACVNYDVKKIVHFSSIARYGDIKPPFKETDTPCPLDVYAIGKYFNELDLKEASHHFGLRYSVVAAHNVLSPAQNFADKFRNVAAIFIRKVILNEPMQIFGDGLQRREFSSAEYLFEPIEKLLYEFDGELFNLGSDISHNLLDLTNTVQLVGEQFHYTSRVEFKEPRLEVKIATADHTKAKTLLGFKDETDLEKLIYEMFEYALKTGAAYEPVNEMDYEITKNMYSYWKK